MKLGSLFDGSGTAPLAAAMNGITPVWASEVEPYPILVTKTRFPNMQHLGSITEIKGNEVVPVDIICGGSPCQDLSVAGRQAGLEGGTRSHLFFEMTRIIKEMREATNGKYPRYIIWENVPGAFSSNNGYDFLSVLQSFAEIAEADVHVPEPERKADRLVWQYAGEMVGNGWSIAWRTVDAQYWGVPQRRRRIYLVADFDSECAGEILFERNGMPGNPEQGGEAREGSAGASEKSTGRDDSVRCMNPWDSQSIRQYDVNGVAPNLNANTGGGQNRWGVCYPSVARTLTAEHDASPCIDRGQNICVFDITGSNSNSIKSDNPHSCFKARDIARTLDSFTGSPECNQGGNVVVDTLSGGNTVPDVCYPINEQIVTGWNKMGDKTGFGVGDKDDPAFTLQEAHPHGVCYCLQGNGIDRADTAGCNGAGWRENESYTLNTIDRPAVCYQNTVGALCAADWHGVNSQYVGQDKLVVNPLCTDARGNGDICSTITEGGSEMLCVYDARGNGDAKIAPTLTGDHNNRVTDYTAICVGNGQLDQTRISPLVGALNCMHDQQIILENNGKSTTNYIVRRLTPLECCRLQGFPDWWENGLAIENPSEEDVAFWHDAFETHRKINNPNGKPKTDNQIIKWLKNPYSDSASYKMWGNGMALPNMMHVMKGIVRK